MWIQYFLLQLIRRFATQTFLPGAFQTHCFIIPADITHGIFLTVKEILT
jgi:hypothetical protein